MGNSITLTINFYIDDDYCYIAGLSHEEPQSYGVLEVDEKGLLRGIVEKPKEYVGNLINTGLYKFTSDVFKYLDQISLSPRGEYELTDVVDILAKKGKMKVKDLRGIWLDFGKPQDITKAEEYLSSKND